MKIDFVSLALENFKSFVEPENLELEPRGVGLHFLRGRNEDEPRLGSNGAGKSTLWDALCWCLFGRTPDGLRNPDIKPWYGKGMPRVMLTLRIDDKPFVIVREARTNGLLIDGEEKGQNEVEALIGLNADIFCHTVLMGQSQPLFFDLQPKQKMDLFTEVLNLEVWNTRSSAATSKTAEQNERLYRLQGQATGLESQKKRIDELLSTARDQQEEWSISRDERIENAQADLKELEERVEKLKDERARVVLASEEAGVQVKLLLPDIEKLDEEIREWQREAAEAEGTKAVLDNTIAGLESALKKSGKDGKCPVCKQSIKGTSFDYHLRKMESDIADTKRKIAKLDLGKFDRGLVKARERRLDLIRILSEERAKESSARDEDEALIRELSRVSAQASVRRDQIEQWSSEDNPYKDQVQKLRREAKKIEVQHIDLNTRMDKLTRIIERTRFWVKGFKDVRLYVIEDVLAELQMTTNAMLEEVGLIGWAVEYAIEKETKSGTIQRGLNVTISSPKNSGPVRWESWSGGEGQRLRLIGALALSEVLLNYAGVEIGMEVLDEPTQHLSVEGGVDLLAFLADRAKVLGRQIWFVDHLTRESARFTSVLTVVKTANGSYIEGEQNAPSRRLHQRDQEQGHKDSPQPRRKARRSPKPRDHSSRVGAG